MAIYRNISREDYNKLEGVNASKLKPYFESSLNGNYENSKPRSETEAMRFGTMTHSMILEPEKFAELYQRMPNEPTNDDGSALNKNTKIYKAWKDSLPQDVEFISHDQWELLERIDANIKADKDTLALLDYCQDRETAMTWIDERTGLKCKALVDYMGKSIVGDVKTIRDLCIKNTVDKTAESLKWNIINNMNALQFAFYFDGTVANELPIEKFAVTFIKNNGSCEVVSAFLTEQTLQIGRDMYNRALDNWIARKENKGFFNQLIEL